MASNMYRGHVYRHSSAEASEDGSSCMYLATWRKKARGSPEALRPARVECDAESPRHAAECLAVAHSTG